MEARQVVLRPVVTEKTSNIRESDNKYVFEVDQHCNKIEIRKAIEEQFKVTVLDVHTYTTHGKVRRQGRNQGRRPDWKRAIVKLKDGDTIEFFEGV